MFKLAFRSIRAPVARASFVKPIRFMLPHQFPKMKLLQEPFKL